MSFTIFQLLLFYVMFAKLIDLHIYLEYIFMKYHWNYFLLKWKYASHILMQRILYHQFSISDPLYQRRLYCYKISGFFGWSHGFCIFFLVTFWKNSESNAVYSVSLRIQSECGKIWPRKTPNTYTFYAVQPLHNSVSWSFYSKDEDTKFMWQFSFRQFG